MKEQNKKYLLWAVIIAGALILIANYANVQSPTFAATSTFGTIVEALKWIVVGFLGIKLTGGVSGNEGFLGISTTIWIILAILFALILLRRK